jgi:hypothetical protein
MKKSSKEPVLKVPKGTEERAEVCKVKVRKFEFA